MKSWWIRLLGYARPHAMGVAFIVVLALAGAGLNALKPWPMKFILDYVLAGMPLPEWLAVLPIPDSAAGQLLLFAAASLVVILAEDVARLIRLYIQTGVGLRMNHGIGADLFSHIQGLSLSFHGRRASGDLLRRVVKDASCVQDLVIGVYVPFIIAMGNLLFMVGIMWQVDRLLTVIAVSAAFPLGIAIRLFSNRLTQRSHDVEAREGAILTEAERTLTALPVVQAFGREDMERERLRTATSEALRGHLNLTKTQIAFTIASTSVTAVGTAVIFALGGFRALDGVLTLGSLVVFTWYVASLYAPLETLVFLSTGLYAARARAEREFEILDVEDGIADPKVPRPITGGRVSGPIELTDVSFRYGDDSSVLTNLNLTIQDRESVALVGPTGAGKTTVARLLLRLADPQSGSVRAGGIDIRSYRVADWRTQIAYVPQEPFILPISVRQNIAYGHPDAPDDAIVAAAKAAQCHDFIERLPEGYETVVGEEGMTLSGGEKQRIAIARAILRNAPILILDEPTASLDAETEDALIAGLRELMKNRITIVVAHRLSTIREVNRVCFLEHGELAEQGSYDALVEKQGRFYEYTRHHAGDS